MQIDKSKPILVTGANGYIASWVVKYLLEDGCTVHATVRDPSNQAKVAHLNKAAEGTSGELKFFAADLLSDGAYDEAMQGCELVMHLASPFVIKNITDPYAQLIDPALQGTRNVLESVNRTDTVKRVVLTSSIVGIHGDAKDMTDQGLKAFTEEQWNTTSRPDHQPYNYSKVVAEKAAWEIAEKQDRWDLLVINPAFVLGPSLTNASASTSLDTMKGLGSGKLRSGVPKLNLSICDVRDVAKAHIAAGFTASASGRHIIASRTMTMLEMAKTLRAKFGKKYPLPTMEAPKPLIWLLGPTQGITREFVSKNVGWPLEFDNSYTKQDLNFEFMPAEQTVCDHFQQMLDDGIIKKR